MSAREARRVQQVRWISAPSRWRISALTWAETREKP